MFTDLLRGPHFGNGAQEGALAPDSPHIMPGRAENGITLRCSWHPFPEEVGRLAGGGHRGDFSSPMFHEGPPIHQPDVWRWAGAGLYLAQPAPRQPLNAADRNQSGSRWPEITAASWRNEAEGMGVGGGKGGRLISSPSGEATRCHPHHPALWTPASAHPGGVFLALFWSGRNRPNAQGGAGVAPASCLLASLPWLGLCLAASLAETDGSSLLAWLW